MNKINSPHMDPFFTKGAHRIFIAIFIIVVVSNLNAVVDSFLHPEIPYLDEEHLIVGGVTGAVSALLFGMLFLYTRHLEKALGTIKVLESILQICSHCKKVVTPGTSEAREDSWVTLESYISDKTSTLFSHGICPECMKKYYPDFDKMNGGRDAISRDD